MENYSENNENETEINEETSTSREIDVRYDLKGSTHGRITRKDPKQDVNSKEALKD